MITETLALRLRERGLRWEPESGDRFAISDHEFANEVFVVAELTIDTVTVGAGRVFRFNGTTEWALDSIDAGECVWLPHEGQLRALLGPAFRSLVLERGEYVVTAVAGGEALSFAARDAECAYALALLACLG